MLYFDFFPQRKFLITWFTLLINTRGSESRDESKEVKVFDTQMIIRPYNVRFLGHHKFNKFSIDISLWSKFFLKETVSLFE